MYVHPISALLVFVAIFKVASVTSTEFCQDGWSYFNQSCFLLSETKETWHKASEQCIKKGGHLARIDSEAKNNYVIRRLKRSGKDEYWYIDGNDELSEGNWKWSSSETPFKYTNWYKGEPNGKTKENCIVIGLAQHSYQWIDAVCKGKFSYLCEKHAQSLQNEKNQSCLSARDLLDELIKCKQGN